MLRGTRRGLLSSRQRASNYLFDDEFSVAVSAPVPSPRAADVIGALTKVDTTDKTSISGGKLVWTSSAANFNPAWVGDTVFAKRAGRAFLFKVDHNANRQQMGCTRSADPASLGNSSSRRGMFDLNGTGLSLIDNGSNTGYVVGTIATSNTYQLAAVMRAGAGMFYFIKGGAFTNWTLLFIDLHDDGGTTARAPFVGAASTTSNMALDYMRVVDLPAPLNDDYSIATVNVTASQQSLGSELLANTGFDSDTVWSKGTGWSISGGVAVKVAGSAASVFQGSIVAQGSFYEHLMTVVSRTAGTIVATAGNAVGASLSAAGAYSTILRPTDTNTNAGAFGDASFAGSVDDVSVKLVTPHPTQTVSANAINGLEVTLPASPVAGQTVRLYYRLTDFDNHWVLYVTRNAGNTNWDLRLDSVVSGTATNRVSVNNIGSFDILRVICDGNNHDIYTRSGTTWTKRGSTVSLSTHASATGLTFILSSAAALVRLVSYPRTSSNYDILDNV